jgi:predicted metal-dependent HD superfamily phosphohydrolase
MSKTSLTLSIDSFMAQFLLEAPAASDGNVVLSLLDKLVAKYAEPEPARYYHNLNHILTGLKTYNELFSDFPNTVDFFAWAYHDVIYDSKASDNEQQSADYFLRDSAALGFTMDEAEKVMNVILSTKISAEPISVINDIDLSGLGAPADVYAQNTINIRKEYEWVEPEVWRSGRSAVLRQFLQRPTLYITTEFFDRFTDQAIINITTELKSLS